MPVADPTAPRVYKVPAHRISIFTEKFEALRRRAAKLGCPMPEAIVGELTVKRIVERDLNDEFEIVSYFEFYPVSVEGVAPRMNGWEFVAVVDHENESPVFRKTVALGDVELPDRFRTLGPKCEHCHTLRGRRETFIVRHEDGRFIQVGRQCLRDFLGHDSPENIAALACLEADMRASLDAEEAGGMLMDGGSFAPDLVWFLAWVVWSIQRWGWLSRRKAEGSLDMSTADRAAKACRDYSKAAREGRADRAQRPGEAHVARAEQVRAWAMALGSDGRHLSDYEHNLKAACTSTVASGKNLGLIASAVVCFDIAEARLRAVNNEHVGKVGDYLRDVRVFVERVFALPMSNYGGHRILMRDLEGHIYTWLTNAARPSQGKEYALSGTIKAHDEYKGVKQTVMTRAELQADDEPTKAEKAFSEILDATFLRMSRTLIQPPFSWQGWESFTHRRAAAVKDVNLVELEALRAELREVLTILTPEGTTREEQDAARSLRAMVLQLDRLAKGYEAPKVSPKVKAHGRALYKVIEVAAYALREWGVSDKGALSYLELAEELQEDVPALLAIRAELRERAASAKPEDATPGYWLDEVTKRFPEIQKRALDALDAKIDLGKGATFNPKTAEKLRRELRNVWGTLSYYCDWPEANDVERRFQEAADRADIVTLQAVRDDILALAPTLPIRADRASHHFDRERCIEPLRPKAKKTTVASVTDVATSE